MVTSELVKKTRYNKRLHDENNEFVSLIPMEESLHIDNKRQRIEHDKSTMIPIKSLPTDLLVNMIARVSSESCIDHYNMKVCCRDFLDASKDNYMWQQVFLEKFPLHSWLSKEKRLVFDSFIKSCKEGGNIEALYREGLQEIIRYMGNVKKGIKDLKMAAEMGHLEGRYVYGLILLCSYEDDLRRKGVEYMQFLRNAKCVVSCRNKVIALLGNIWRRPYGTLVRNPTPLCRDKLCNGWSMKKNHSWKMVNNEDDDVTIKNSCEYCRWDVELDFLYNVLA